MLHVRIFTDSVSFTDISRFKVEGMKVTLTRGWIYQPCDVAIMYGLANAERRSLQGQLRNSIHREHKGPIVVIESSLLGRGFKAAAPRWFTALRRRPLRPRQVHPYFRVGVGGALGDDADFGAAGSPPDRWNKQSRELQIRRAPYRKDGQHILILGQVARDASLRGLDIAKWLGDTARDVRERSDRPIVVRLHPSMRWRDRQKALVALEGISGLTISPVESSFSHDIKGAWTCVTYSSGGAVDALLAGVPPICLSPANLAYRICSRSLDDLDAPLEPDTDQFLRDLAYSQWTPAEMADGTAWRHILPAVQRKLDESTEARASQRMPGAGLPAGKRRELFWRLNGYTWFGQLLPKSRRALQGRAEALLGLGYAAEAKATFERLQELYPTRSSGYRGAAKAAEQLGLWEDALQGWTAVHTRRPTQVGALSGMGRAAMRLGQLDIADNAYRDLMRVAPEQIWGVSGRERVATDRGDWAEALEMQRLMWTRFKDETALRRQALLLTRLDRLDDLRQLVASLSEAHEPAAYLLAITPLQAATHAWQETADLLDRHRELVLNNWQLFRMHIVALRRLGRIEDAIALLELGTGGSQTQRASLKIECLYEARRYGEADRLLQAAWESGALEQIGGGNIAAMMTAAQELGGLSMARAVLDAIVPSEGRAGRSLRLNRLIQHRRLDSFAALAEGRVHTGTSLEEQVLAALDGNAAVSESDLRGICAAMAMHRVVRPDGHHVDASFQLCDALEVAVRIVDAADAATPFALVRLGDGEGAMLPYRSELAAFRATDLAENSKTWWGTTGAPTEALAAELATAVRAADIVGIPDLDRASRVFDQTERTAHLANGRNLRGLLAATGFAAANCAEAVWTTCHIHQSLAFWGLWDMILPRLGSVDLITCHPQLGDVLKRQHGLHVGRTHRIPPEQKYAAGFAPGSGTPHFPDVFEQLRQVLPQAARGRTVLVSAGMLGKIYCHWIKQAGGVAIDIGSAADHWCGYGTRGIADVAIYRSPTGTAEMVRASIAGDERYATLLRRVETARRGASA